MALEIAAAAEIISHEVQVPVNVVALLTYAAINPATVATAFFMGRKANELPKILIAAFAGAVAGAALLYIATYFEVWDAPKLGRGAAGSFIASLAFGLIYAWVGYLSANASRPK